MQTFIHPDVSQRGRTTYKYNEGTCQSLTEPCTAGSTSCRDAWLPVSPYGQWDLTFEVAGQQPTEAFAHVDRLRLIFKLEYYKEFSSSSLDPRMFDWDAVAHCGKPVCNLIGRNGDISNADCLAKHPCAAKPCKHGGVCTEDHYTFSCKCPAFGEFVGDRCEIARNPCTVDNGGCGDFGRCSMLVPGVATCSCLPGFVSDAKKSCIDSGQSESSGSGFGAATLCNGGSDPKECSEHPEDCSDPVIGDDVARYCPVMCGACPDELCNGVADPDHCASLSEKCNSDIVGERLSTECPITCGTCAKSNTSPSGDADSGEAALTVTMTLIAVGLLVGAAVYVVRIRGGGGEIRGKSRSKFSTMTNEAYDIDAFGELADSSTTDALEEPVYERASTGDVDGATTDASTI